MRYVTKNAVEGLVQKLGFPAPGPYDQDWEYTIADATRVAEWIGAYAERQDLTDEERFALMITIIESFNDALRGGTAKEADWERIRQALKSDYALHEATIEYWSLPDETDLENVFEVTPRLRKIREEEDFIRHGK